MAGDTIKASEKALVDVFCDKYLFSIPPYQRPYAWTTDEAGEMLDDLILAIGEGEPAEQSPYFLGSIVLIKNPEQPEADVVDGQQRLTTLTILISVLRDIDPEQGAEHIHPFVCEKGSPFRGTKDRYRLRLRERDANFFERAIQVIGATNKLPEVAGLTDSQANFVRNADHFKSKLQSLPAETRNRLVTYIVQQCYLVVVEASDAESAYRVFSVMNARGLDLSPTDILKAEIIGALPIKDRESYTTAWEYLEEELGREKFRDLFGHIRLIHRQQKMRGTLEAEFREYVQPAKQPAKFIDQTLTPLAESYLTIVNQDFASQHHAEVINRYLSYLSRLDNFDWEAPAILFLSKHRDNPGQIRRFVIDLDRLAYGLFILRANINDRISRHSKVIAATIDGSDLFSAKSPLQLSKEERETILQLLGGDIYLSQRVRLPILLRLDEAQSEGEANYDHRIITVEHVLPQKPADDSVWCKWYPTPELRASWVHKIGNLVLLSRAKNSQAQNFDFDRKKREYFSRKGTSPFAITSQVLASQEWGPGTLEQRQHDLLNKLADIWHLKG